MNKCFKCGSRTTRRLVCGVVFCSKCHPHTKQDAQYTKMAKSLGKACASHVDEIISMKYKHKEKLKCH